MHTTREDSLVYLLYAMTTALREGFSLEERLAAVMAEPLVEALRKHYGCERLYVPAESRSTLYAGVLKEFDGKNANELQRKFNISRRQFYRIIGKKRN